MLSTEPLWDPDRTRSAAGTAPGRSDDQAVVAAQLLAAGLIEFLGPLFWAVLIVGFLVATTTPGPT